ncbi:MAG: glucose 1-dehydrogenase [Novosphingobium sp.]|nr:glucose 1-dehydrogenase [Novosphingobium sp.]MCP5403725.1 glucose 1-dehydrogenase [Novosphingobium sp.]
MPVSAETEVAGQAQCRRFEGRVALVTGAASGIGAATARRLAGEGASVVLADRDHDGAEDVRAGLPDRETHIAAKLDVTREAEWTAVLESVSARYGRLDVLVNNAGWSRSAAIADTSLEDWREIVAVHLEAMFVGIRHSLPLLAVSGKGAVVNVSSIRSYVASPGAAAYSAAKSGITMLTKVAALEWADEASRVRFNSVHPGFVRTGLGKDAPPEQVERLAATVPFRRLAAPEEVASAIAFLASDDASYMTGSELVVDGGVTAG